MLRLATTTVGLALIGGTNSCIHAGLEGGVACTVLALTVATCACACDVARRAAGRHPPWRRVLRILDLNVPVHDPNLVEAPPRRDSRPCCRDLPPSSLHRPRPVAPVPGTVDFGHRMVPSCVPLFVTGPPSIHSDTGRGYNHGLFGIGGGLFRMFFTTRCGWRGRSTTVAVHHQETGRTHGRGCP